MKARQVNISGLDKADVLIALYNQAMAFLGRTLSKEEAQAEISRGEQHFATGTPYAVDYLNGVALKVTFKGKFLLISEYDAGYGVGTAAKVIEKLRKGDLTPPPSPLPKFLGIFERSHFDSKASLKKMFADSDFEKTDVSNPTRDGFDFSQLKEGETLIAICTSLGKEPLVYECSSSEQVKQTRDFDSVDWYTRKKTRAEIVLQTQQIDDQRREKAVEEDKATLRPW